ncbi:hypothetical protein HK099_002394 [Clydaea vesicula]|uniref:Metallo-beta-lactamase domain-containing protein n=1 Tax=Clydaea vesicula TaxID=447962 RepID=A0AAD5U711_9FUNG|nr:hypothetical protein HK099_002394 [Clydaea vesicula]KAJ3382787.1 hypothetical protein HDU92_004555 [Lobulomyces angularis]
MTIQDFKLLNQIGTNFWNIRAPYKMLGIIDVGTHMSIVRKRDGRFICIDTVNLDGELLNEINQLTENGDLIDAVIATHPFHTEAFPKFYQHFPKPKYYGTPRHLRTIQEVPWTAELLSDESLTLFEPDLYLRIPAGCEYVDPKPKTTNHFSNIFVFHPESKTLHNNDTILVYQNPGFLLSFFAKDGEVKFHKSMCSSGLYPTKEAPLQFKAWLEKLLNDWDFDNICSAHNGNLIGGANAVVRQTLTEAIPQLQKLSEKNSSHGEHHSEGVCT